MAIDFYPLVKRALFSLSPETAHNVTVRGLSLLGRSGIPKLLAPSRADADQPVTMLGLTFRNPVGIAAGFDKDGVAIDALFQLGFGFVEVGTLTPRPQPGNAQPRLFRLPDKQAAINRMGFNNQGVEAFVKRMQGYRAPGVLAVNIGKNASTPIERAVDDYLTGFRAVAPLASLVVVNISSPNTVGLRSLQQGDHLRTLLGPLKEAQSVYQSASGRHVPIAVKVSPDMSSEDLNDFASVVLDVGMDAIIATNTTIDRTAIAGHPLSGEQGGLSGAPLRERSTAVLTQLAAQVKGRIPLIGSGGILTAADAMDKFRNGATLIQLYTGLIYRGPELLREILRALRQERPTAV